MQAGDLQEAVQRFLEQGGQVQQVPIGMSGDKAVSIWARGVMVVSEPPKPKPLPKRQPGPPSMKPANEGKRRKAAEARRILAVAVRHCAMTGMSVSATAAAVGVTRVHVRKVAAEHNIKFTTRSPA